MNKEELIELSDLNREDNVKYISSEAQGIAIALNSDIYAPILCKLERAYICGRRKSEKRITELEKENANLKALRKYELNVSKLEIEKLEKENAELKARLNAINLAGLKAGKDIHVPTKWHKVVDGDLPSEEGGWVCNQDGLPCYYDWDTEQWLDCEGTQIRTTEWCHMPHKE